MVKLSKAGKPGPIQQVVLELVTATSLRWTMMLATMMVMMMFMVDKDGDDDDDDDIMGFSSNVTF